jgi:hypothetical protein
MALRILRLSVCGAALAAAAALAQPAAAEKVVLSAVMIRTTDAHRQRVAYQPITVLIDVANRKRAEFVCAVAPRLHDGIVRAFNRTRFVRDPRGNIALDGLKARLRHVLTDALEWDIIDELTVRMGAPKLPAVAMTRLYEHGCMTMSEEDAMSMDSTLAPATMPADGE